MRPQLLMTLILGFSFHAFATDSDVQIKSTGRDSAELTLKLDGEEDSEMAAVYADGAEIDELITLLLKDPNSIVSQAKAAVEKENCDPSIKATERETACGRVEIMDPVRVGFAKDGRARASAEHLVLVGFRERSTSASFSARRMIVISESVRSSGDGGSAKALIQKSYKVLGHSAFTLLEEN